MESNYTINLKKIVITGSEIKKMPKQKKKQYLMLTNMLRDLNLLQKLSLFVKPSDRQNEALQSASVTMSFFFLKTLISKNHEMWKFITKEKIIEQKGTFSKELRDALEQIEIFFNNEGQKKLFCFIRNKLGFHYEAQKDIEPVINEVMDSFGDIDMWLSDTFSGDEVFSSSNGIMMEVIFRKMKELGFNGDDKGLLEELFKLTLKVSRLLREFCTQYLTEIVFSDIELVDKGTVDVAVPLLSQVELPFFVKMDRDK